MEADIVDGKLGTVGAYDVEFKSGKLCFSISANVPVGEAVVMLKLDAAAILDVIAKAIPGTIDDVVLGVAKAALSGV